MKIYDRQPAETPKAYAAFCIYRDLGADRSLLRTANNFYPRQSPDNPPTHPNIARIERWSKAWRWVDRCRDYDRDIESSNRQFLLDVRREQYLARCDDLRANTEAAGFEAIEASRNLTAVMIEISAELRQCSGKKISEYTAREIDLIISLPNSLKSAICGMSSGVQLGADALGLSDKIEKMTKALDRTKEGES